MRHPDYGSGYLEALDANEPILGAGYPIENWYEHEDPALEKGSERQTSRLLPASVRLWILG